MEDAVTAILPTLVGQPLVRLARIFDEAVAIPVAIIVDPGERGDDVGPDVPDRVEIAGALIILRGKHHEQWRGINRSIITAERHLAERRHLAAAPLVQDFARLGIRRGVMFGRLQIGQRPEHAFREIWCAP